MQPMPAQNRPTIQFNEEVFKQIKDLNEKKQFIGNTIYPYIHELTGEE